VCNESDVVGEEEVPDQLLHGLPVALTSAEVEKVAVKAAADVDAIFNVFRSLLEHLTEEDGEESRCQDANMFHTVCD